MASVSTNLKEIVEIMDNMFTGADLGCSKTGNQTASPTLITKRKPAKKTTNNKQQVYSNSENSQRKSYP